MSLRKYVYALGLGVKETMAYRADFWLSLVGAAFPILIQIFMWDALYKGSGSALLYGRSQAGMMAYSVSAAIIWRLLRTGFEYDINEDIKNGGLSKYVIRPVGYLPYRLFCFAGQKLGMLLGGLLLLALALLGVGLAFHALPVSLAGVLMFLPALLFALLLNFLIFFCVGMWAFWLSEIGFLFEAVRIFIVVLCGCIFPLEFFGESMRRVLGCLPFAYSVGFPVDVLGGTVTGAAVFAGLGMQAAWIVLLLLLGRLLWRLGSQKYLAAGG